MKGVDHLDLVVTDLERSLAFYNSLLEPLGFTRNSEIEGERGERVVYLAVVASSREQVDERAAWLRERGAEIVHRP